MKNKSALKITTGAMVTAIFGVMLLLNRQTGSMFQEIFLFLYPIPMVAYAAMYGFASGLPVLAAMGLISFLFGNITSIFYAVTQVLLGLVFGTCLNRKMDMTKTLFVVMLLSTIFSLLNTVVFGAMFGIDLNQETAEMQVMMNQIFKQAGVELPAALASGSYLKQLVVVSMALYGIMEGFIIYEVSLLLLRRLRFPVQKPKSVYLYYPPKWMGYAAVALFIAYSSRLNNPLPDERLQNAVLTIGIMGYIFLLIFGFIAMILLLKVKSPKLGFLSGIISTLIFLILPFLILGMGFFYVSGSFHDYLLEQYQPPVKAE